MDTYYPYVCVCVCVQQEVMEPRAESKCAILLVSKRADIPYFQIYPTQTV